MRVKGVYIIYTLLTTVAILSVIISYLLLRNIFGSRGLQQKSFAPGAKLAATQHPQGGVENLNFPNKLAPTEEVDTFYVATLERAKKTDTIKISNCHPNPEIIRVAPKTQVTVINTDKINQIISIDRNHTYIVPAGKQTTFAADFGKNIGAYAYQCNSGTETAGIIVVTQNQE